MAELSKGPMPDQVTAMAMYEHVPNPDGVRPQRLVGVDKTPVARIAAKVLSSEPMSCDAEQGTFWSCEPMSRKSWLLRRLVRGWIT